VSIPPDSLPLPLVAVSPWAAAAVILALAYLALAIRESLWCWPAGMASTAIYLVLMYRAALYMETALQVFYMAVSAYGWWRWRGGGARSAPRISTWRWQQHGAALCAVLALSAASGAWLATATDAAFPYVDSFITWGSVVTTWMVARKIFENWVYWFVIDSLCVYVYASRGLALTAGLFVLYLVLVVIGFRTWLRRLRASPA
jgi:nicotinamide mononucleotide transporter